MFNNVTRFLLAQKRRMMLLDEAEGLTKREDSGFDFSQIDEQTGKRRGLREILYDNTIAWLLNDGYKTLTNEFGLLERPGALNEETLTTSFAAYTTFLLPAVRRIYRRLLAMELVSVQPLPQPRGYVFWVDHLFGTSSGGATAGERLDQHLYPAYGDSSEKGTIREINLKIRKKIVEAETKKLQAIWTLEAQQDLKSQWGLSLTDELMPKTVDEITREIDNKILLELLAQVGTNTDWNCNGYLSDDKTTTQRKAYKESLYEAIIATAAKIYKRKYLYPNWLLMNPDTFTYFAKLEKFVVDPTINLSQETFVAWQYVGKLETKFKVFVDPDFTDNVILMGFRSDDWKYAVGYYAPFIPLMLSEEFSLGGDFSQRARGVMSRYAYGAIGDSDVDDLNYGLASVTITQS